MPTYPYRCQKCGHSFDLFQKITDEPIKDCPQCKAEGHVQREIGGGAALLRFEGTGYYITDYKRSSSSEEGAPQLKKPGGCGGGCACGKPPSK